MIPLLSVSGMRAIDDDALGDNAKIGYEYMLRAGRAIADAARRIVPDPHSGDIAIVCGKGNNGGDGYVAGRLLMEAGYGIMCFALCEGNELKAEARRAFDEFVEKNGNILILDDAADCAGFYNYILVIDAILGTGVRGAPRGLAADVIAAINACGKAVLAVDTPSGLDNDTGQVPGACVKASVTIACGFAKIGAYFYPGRMHVGTLSVADIGYPPSVFEKHFEHWYVPEISDLRSLLPSRKAAGSKFDHGQALIIAGSRGMTGAAILVAEAALRSGCGMAHIAAPFSALPSLAAHAVEAVLHPIAETEVGTAALDAVAVVLDLGKRTQAACLGPGMSHETETTCLVRTLIKQIDQPIILDADGINAFKGCVGELSAHRNELVITPHAGEWERLFGPLPAEPLEIARVLRVQASALHIIILLKGNPTLLVSPDGKVYVLPFGSSALATAGCGDVLSGMIVSLMAQGASAINAAMLAGYLHGRAGSIAARQLTEYGVIARDVVQAIPEAIKELIECQP